MWLLDGEANMRMQHRYDCVCIGDKGHLDRIHLLQQTIGSLAEKLLQLHPQAKIRRIVPTVKIWNSLFTADQLGALFYVATKLKNLDEKIKTPIITEVQDLTMRIFKGAKNKRVDKNGTIQFDGITNYGWLKELWDKGEILQPLVHSQIMAFMKDAKTYEDGVGCLQYEGGEIIDVKIDGPGLQRKVKKQLHIQVDIDFFTKLAETAPVDVYRTCIRSMMDYRHDLFEKLCMMRKQFSQVPKALLDQTCGDDGSGGDGGLTQRFAIASQWNPQITRMIMKEQKISVGDDLVATFANQSLKTKKKILRLLEERIEYERQWLKIIDRRVK